MKILDVAAIRYLDEYTIQNEPVSSLELMERAAQVFVNCLYPSLKYNDPLVIFCGPGNNGGDGLAAARILADRSFRVQVIICEIGTAVSADFRNNLERLRAQRRVEIIRLKEADDLPIIVDQAVIIDALFGSGLNREISGYWAALIQYLNRQGSRRVSIDIPSGMFADCHTRSVSILADRTITFEVPKLGFFLPENAHRLGVWSVESIGLHSQGLASLETDFHWCTMDMIQDRIRKRNKFDHKGTFGHALLVAGQEGKIGAALLAGMGCLRAGAGLLTVHTPRCGYPVLQTSLPEAMVSVDRHDKHLSSFDGVNLQTFRSIGIGCGIGIHQDTRAALDDLLSHVSTPMVFDADALNLLGLYPEMFSKVPEGSILTPHPGEFNRLFKFVGNDFERLQLLRDQAKENKVYILLKGAFSCLATPEGMCYFNGTGNPGMATAGSGDVLTGILTGLLAQGYPPEDAGIVGMWIHGLAGDLASQEQGQEGMIARDINNHIGKSIQLIHQSNQEYL